jgi:TolA-binding protein
MSKRDEIENLQLAFALHRSGRYADAAKAYRKVIKRNPSATLAALAGPLEFRVARR